MAETVYDSAVEIAPLIRRMVVNNPSPMTGRGTNSYLLGSSDLIAIDPGPGDSDHVDAIVNEAGGRLRYIIVTHAHPDHYPGAVLLGRSTGVPVLSFGPRGDFKPDGTLGDGDVVKVPGISLRAVHTPGHCSDHLCYLVEAPQQKGAVRLLFSGDHILGGTTTVISPLDGDMAAYFSSLERLLALGDEMSAIAPGHGEVIDDAHGVVSEYLEHRKSREREVLDALRELQPADTAALVEVIYVGYSPFLQQMARRSVWAHLRKLFAEGVVTTDAPDDSRATWQLV